MGFFFFLCGLLNLLEIDVLLLMSVFCPCHITVQRYSNFIQHELIFDKKCFGHCSKS